MCKSDRYQIFFVCISKICLGWCFGYVHFLHLPEAVWGTCMMVTNCFTTRILPQVLSKNNSYIYVRNTTSVLNKQTPVWSDCCCHRRISSDWLTEKNTSESRTAPNAVRITKARVVSICSYDKTALINCTASAQTFVSPWILHHQILGKFQQLTIH